MSNLEPGSYRWMRDLLNVLFEDVDITTAAKLLRDRDERARFSGVVPRVVELRSAHPEVGDDEFDNLFVALLALRAKFDRNEASSKVELNIAMREGRR